MTRYFLQDTPLADFEKEMMRPPGFRKRGGGRKISCFNHSAGCDCGYCLKFAGRKRPCGAFNCICFGERLIECCWSYSELVCRLMEEAGIPTLLHRARNVFKEAELPFRDTQHKERIWLLWQCGILYEYQMPSAFAAVIYLLTADALLWEKSESAVFQCYIDFNTIDIRGITIEGYALYLAAKSIYLGKLHISLAELCDPEIISDELYRLILTAYTIRRYGMPVIKGLERRF